MAEVSKEFISLKVTGGWLANLQSALNFLQKVTFHKKNLVSQNQILEKQEIIVLGWFQ